MIECWLVIANFEGYDTLIPEVVFAFSSEAEANAEADRLRAEFSDDYRTVGGELSVLPEHRFTVTHITTDRSAGRARIGLEHRS